MFSPKNAFPPEKKRIPERNRTLSPPEKAWRSLGNTFLSVAEAFSRMESRLPTFKTTFLAAETDFFADEAMFPMETGLSWKISGVTKPRAPATDAPSRAHRGLDGTIQLGGK